MSTTGIGGLSLGGGHGFDRELPDEAIGIHVERGSKPPSGLSLISFRSTKAVQRVPSDATAWSCRDPTWSMVIAGVDPESFTLV